MPSSSTITAPFWRGYILLEMNNGKTYKYVRNVIKNQYWVADSISRSYYTWGDTILDDYNETSDTIGRIKFDYELLSRKLMLGGDTYIKWPESGGDTFVLKRVNREQLYPVNIVADTWSYRLQNVNVFTLTRIKRASVSTISVIQERIPDWYKESWNGGNAS